MILNYYKVKISTFIMETPTEITLIKRSKLTSPVMKKIGIMYSLVKCPEKHT